MNVPKPWPKENLCKIAKFVPVKDQDMLNLFWVLPLYAEKDIKNRPEYYFSHLVGHEGENSLLSYLISEGLATELYSCGDHCLGAYSLFIVNIVLTKKGLENVNSVVEAVFQYCRRIRDAGP